MSTKNRVVWIATGLTLLVAGGFALRQYTQQELPEGIVGSNGRIESQEINVASKTSGRIMELLVDEGDYVSQGDVLGRLDTTSLSAQLREAEAQLQSAVIGIETSTSQVKQREAECSATRAVVAQREAERNAAEKRAKRTEELADKGIATQQTYDDDLAAVESARAAVAAAEAQVAAADAACDSAKALVAAARASVAAAKATIERIAADIDDAILRAPSEGRIQYRVVQPGEVVSAGGVVLNIANISDVYMTFFLPTQEAGQLALGSQARIVLDAFPDQVIPATISFVSDTAQFTPKTVETKEERQKLMFRVKAKVDPDVLRKYLAHVKTGLPGMAYTRLRSDVAWPEFLQATLP